MPTDHRGLSDAQIYKKVCKLQNLFNFFQKYAMKHFILKVSKILTGRHGKMKHFI